LLQEYIHSLQEIETSKSDGEDVQSSWYEAIGRQQPNVASSYCELGLWKSEFSHRNYYKISKNLRVKSAGIISGSF